MRKHTLFLSLILGTLSLLPAAAQKITFDDAMGGFYIRTSYGEGVDWLPDEGNWYSEWGENNTLVAHEMGSKKSKTLLDGSLLKNPETGESISIRNYSFSADKSKVLIYTNSRRVWRYDTRGDYWILDLTTKQMHQLGKGLPESSLMFAKFSPDSKRVAYVSKNNIYVEESDGSKMWQLTRDGSDECVNGTFDWVYEEEFDLRDGFRWSPDSKTIAYWQSDTKGTGWFQIINNVDSLYPFVNRFPYPKAGTTNSAVRVGTIPAQGGETTWIALPGDARNNYVVYLDFIPQSNELFIQQMNREQNCCKVWTAGADGSNLKNIFTDKDAAWVELYSNIRWLDHNRYFTWMSERSGWRHLYRVSRDGSNIEPITSGNFDFIDEAGIDEKRGLIYFTATPVNYTQRYLYSAQLMGKGEVKRVTPAGQEGQHSYSISAAGDYAVHTFGNANTPPYIELITLPAHKQVKLYTDNADAKKQMADRKLRPVEFVKAQSDGWTLDGWMIKPCDFDSTKKYPVILDIYGEPASSTVQDSWSGGDIWHRYLADLGYIVMSIDPRGTATPRGREWRKCVYGEVGTLASLDLANAIRDLARQYSFIDLSRIGITGWSGGGSQTLNCMFRYPDVFATGIAVAFVADQKLYDTVYQERYMNTPQNNPEGYRKGSPITYAQGLKGNLLLIHGTGDDNVHYQNCERLVNELVKNGKIFSQTSYPMRTHGISERQGTSRHLRMTMSHYWLQNLPAGGR